MKVNNLIVDTTQESRIPATNHARDAMVPFLGSRDQTSTDSLCEKCETENNDLSTSERYTDDWWGFLPPRNHNSNHRAGTTKNNNRST